MLFSTKEFRVCAAIGCASLAVLATGCIDDSYDLSNIDSNFELKIDDLTVPFEMKKEVTLSTLVDAEKLNDPDADPDAALWIDGNGNYLVKTDGTFNTDVDIKAFSAELKGDESDKSMSFPVAPDITVDIASEPEESKAGLIYDFSYDNDHVDEYIQDIEVVYVKFSITLEVTNSADVEMTDMQFQFPDGLSGRCYDSYGNATCEYDNGVVTAKGTYKQLRIVFDIDNIDIHKAGGHFDNHHFTFENQIGILGGQVTSQVVASNVMKVDYDLSTLYVNAITGTIHYDAEVDTEEVSLTDLPDELRQPGTNLVLLYPQIDFTIHNPLAQYGVYAHTGLDLYQVRGTDATYVTRVPEFNIGGDKEHQLEVESICLAANRDHIITTPGTAFNQIIVADSLGYVLATNLKGINDPEASIPDALNVEFVNPGIPYGTKVREFPIGSIQNVYGDYSFIAPLAIGKGSQISYSDEDHSISIDDDIVLDKIQIKAHVISTIPLGVTLSAEPLDDNGDPIKGVKVEDVKLAADADQEVELYITGNIAGIHGIRYVATIDAPANTMPLNEANGLKLTKIRATFNGSYKTSF